MSKKKETRIETDGGAYIGGKVEIHGGDFVGRDKIVHGDEITVGGVGGENIALAAGRRAGAEAVQGVGGQDLAALFAQVYRQIEARPEDPDVDKEELTETVQKVEGEAAKGEEANPRKVERWLRFLGEMAPDILEVTAACLTNPAAGVATVIRKVAEKAKAEAQAAP